MHERRRFKRQRGLKAGTIEIGGGGEIAAPSEMFRVTAQRSTSISSSRGAFARPTVAALAVGRGH
jgi:hypothetical protein